MSRTIDYTGHKFGHLTALNKVKDGSHRSKYECVCDCGNHTVKLLDSLRRSQTISCGCMDSYYRSIWQRKDETGNKYNYLTILSVDYSKKPTKAICLCDCGNTVEINKTEVVNGFTKSCGCYQKMRAGQANTKDYTGYVSESGVTIVSKAYRNEKSQWMWNCKCPLCGEMFVALPAKVMNNHTTSCGCKIQSSMERSIETFLKSLNIKYETQKRFPDCKYHYTLAFDFALYNDSDDLLCLIEYDGRQHFQPVEFFGGEESYTESLERDKIKDDYCKENSIRLIRFDYTMNIDEIKECILNIIYP